MNRERFEEPPELDAEDEAILARIHDEIGLEHPMPPPPIRGDRERDVYVPSPRGSRTPYTPPGR